jgi:hypothetical protein
VYSSACDVHEILALRPYCEQFQFQFIPSYTLSPWHILTQSFDSPNFVYGPEPKSLRFEDHRLQLCHEILVYLEVEVEVALRLTVSQYVDKTLLSVGMSLSEICCFVFVGRPPWREVGSAICHSQSVVIHQYLHKHLHLLFSPGSVQQILLD